MPIKVYCPGCKKNYNASDAMAGKRLRCPGGHTVLVPPASSQASRPPSPRSQESPAPVKPVVIGLIAAAVLALLLAGVGGALFLAFHRSPAHDAVAQLPPSAAAGDPDHAAPLGDATKITKPLAQPGDGESADDLGKNRMIAKDPAAPDRGEKDGKVLSKGGTEKTQPPPAKPPEPVLAKPPPPQQAMTMVLDSFGNPAGSNLGLARDGEFKGQRLTIWCGSPGFLAAFFPSENPLLKALKAKGFTLQLREGQFQTKWLRETDQLWICSVCQGEKNYPDKAELPLLKAAVARFKGMTELEKSSPPLAGGSTLRDVQAVMQAVLDPPAIDERGYAAIEEFVKAGKGLYLLADDEPFTMEADAMTRRLFGARVVGNYPGEKIAYIRTRKLSAEEIRRYKGDYAIDDHPLLTGVNFMYEGVTISHVELDAGPPPGRQPGTGSGGKLRPIVRASDGQILVAISQVPGWRVAIDCGYTRYTYGSGDATRFVNKSAGTIRFAENVAAYLAGKDR